MRRAVSTDPEEQQTAKYVIYGYVCFIGGTDGRDTVINASGTLPTKTNGFIDTTGGYEYNTFNLQVTKAVTGTLAETSHDFPFQVVLSNTNTNLATQMWYAKTENDGTEGTGTVATLSAGTVTIGTLDTGSVISLSHGDSTTIYGIPAGTTATVQENNDTYDVYTASATITSATALTYTPNQVQSKTNATITGSVDNATTVEAVGSANSVVAFSNALDIVSPTGVVLRVAPYAILLGAGVVLLMAASRRREEEEDA